MITVSEVSDLLRAVAWPTVTLLILVLFRSHFQELIKRDDFKMTLPGGFSVSAKSQVAAADALQQAAASRDGEPLPREVAEAGIEAVAQDVHALGRSPQLLWVDDRPSNNRFEAAALGALGMHIQFSTSTEDALRKLAAHGPYDVVISDMGRPPDPQAGYTLLAALRKRGNYTPFVIYASSRSAEHFDMAVSRGAVGCTNQPDELIELVSNALRARHTLH